MKRIVLLSLVCALIFSCVFQTHAAASSSSAAPAKKPAPPGVEMAQALSTITGVAISPLIGVTVVGIWKYIAAESEAEREKLPWFGQPWFWLPALIVIGLCTAKDTFGMAVPAPLKKPFDVLETIEHKVSGLVAIGAFVPFAASVFHSAGIAAPASLSASAGHGFLAAINASWFYNALSVPIMMVVFAIVFLASNAINILILLSPFPVVDAALKSFRLFILSTVAVTSLANPWMGGLWSLVIIFIAYFIAGWSLRLSHFGLVFLWEFCTFRRLRFAPAQPANWMFLARKVNDVPTRTYGKFFRDEKNDLVFHYHPWLVLPQRTLVLPAGTYAVGKGLVYSEIVRVEGDSTRSVLLLPPRYRSHEQELSDIYGFMGVRDTGLRAAFVWLKEWLGFKAKPAAAIPV